MKIATNAMKESRVPDFLAAVGHCRFLWLAMCFRLL